MKRRMSPWRLEYHSWDPDDQRLREALCALGNGRIVTRGAFEEATAGPGHSPGTYLAGGYNRLETEMAGRTIENEDLVNWPNWLPLTFRIEGGDWFELDRVELLDQVVRLDVRRGVLERSVHFRDHNARETRLESRRIVSMDRPHLGAIEWSLTPVNWSGEVEIRSALDGEVINANVERYRELASRHLEVLETGASPGSGGSAPSGEEVVHLTVQTTQSKVRMSQAARTRIAVPGDGRVSRRWVERDGGWIAHHFALRVTAGEAVRVEKVVAIRTSRDFALSETRIDACRDALRAPGFEALLERHTLKWRHLWDVADLRLSNGDAETQLILRLHIFHLLQTVSENSIDYDVGVPARGWHGEAYRGHIFWDELFIFPYLTLRFPELARSLLLYRYRRLDEARALARRAGYAGAMYPWQSGSDGREETQQVHLNPASGRWIPDESHRQRHVNAAIAYNIWRYYEGTGDTAFLAAYGAEMIIEIARFWASIASWNETRRRYEIHRVMGPDEFHTRYPGAEEPGLANNAYTNVMAAWVLRRASTILDLLDAETRDNLTDELRLEEGEIDRWEKIARAMHIPFHGDRIISQFEGYEKLEEFDWEGYAQRYGNIQRLDRILEAENDDVNRYQASKQADVLMLFYLFSPHELCEIFSFTGHHLDQEMIDRNIEYYLQRTSHGSTLSRIVHYWVATRADRGQDWTLFQEALRSDIDDVQGGTTHEGIHLGAMAGTVDLIQRCHTGLEMRDGVLWFDPAIPPQISDVRMRLHYRGHWLTVHVLPDMLTISFDRGRSPAVRIGVGGEVVQMQQGERREFRTGTS